MQITIPAEDLTFGFHPQSKQPASTGTCTAIHDSTTITGPFKKAWVGLGGFHISLDGVDYIVRSVPTVDQMDLETTYAGPNSSTVNFEVVPVVVLRFYALQRFTAQSNQEVIQPGSPGSATFYRQYGCSAENSHLRLPVVTLESTRDAVNPGERDARYFAGFYGLGGGLITPYYDFEQFSLPSDPSVQTWAQVSGYNHPGVSQPPNYDTFTKDQILQLFATIGINVAPPLEFDGTTLSIPRASETQDGYLAAEDYQTFIDALAGGIAQIDTGTGLTGGPIIAPDGGTIAMADIPGVEGMYDNPSMTVNAQGQITAIVSGTGGPVTAPIIDSVASNVTGATTATITWHTDVLSNSQVEYGTDGITYGTLVPPTPAPAGVASHTVNLTGLTGLTTYHYHVKSGNSAGTTTSTADDTFTTLPTPDTTPPVITPGSIIVTGLSTVAATIEWVTNELSDSRVDYGTSTSYGSVATANPIPPGPGTLTHSVPIGPLILGTPYHYKVASKDAAGNQTLPSGDLTFSTPATSPPIISGITVPDITSFSVNIHWMTDVNADSTVLWGTDGVSYSSTPTTDTGVGVTSHLVTLLSLIPATTYHYKVRSTTASGTATSPDATFMTAAVPDLLTGLISMWKMDETGTGTPRLDSAPAANHNDFTATIVTTVAGVIFNAGHVPGTGDRMILTSNPTMQTGAVDFVWAMWCKIDDKTHNMTFLSKGGGAGDEYFVSYEFPDGSGGGDAWSFGVYASSTFVTVVSTIPVVTGQWYFVVGWHDQTAGEIKIQVNDGAIATLPAGMIVVGGSDVYIFTYGNGIANYTSGAADEIAFWKGRLLGPVERTALFNLGHGLPLSSWT